MDIQPFDHIKGGKAVGKIVKLTAEKFAEKVKALEVGAYFSFAAEADCDGEPQNEEELYEWYGAQKICLFDNEMCVVSKYGGKGCDAFSTDDDYLKLSVDEMFRNMLWNDGVYIANEEAKKPELTVRLTPSYCVEIKGCTNCGENVLIPSKKVHNLFCEIEEYDTLLDINKKTCELKLLGNFEQKELRRMAERVINRRENCDIISEAYWQIVEEVIQEFSAEKKQEAQSN